MPDYLEKRGGYVISRRVAWLVMSCFMVAIIVMSSCRPVAEKHQYDFSPIDRLLEKSLSRVGGGCALILIQDGEVIYRKAFGNFTTETVIPIASASKGISAGVIMALVDRGLISLDDNAGKFLPNFTGKKGEITIRQMFSHTHGFPNEPAYHWNTGLTMEEAVNRIAQVSLVADPGTALYYSGLGMQVAGRIAEVVTGKPWVDIFQETIGGPCEMKKISYYAFGETKNPNVAGSVQTCIDDYGNYMWMLVNKGVFKGKRVLSEEAVSQMLRNQTDDVPILQHPWEAYREFSSVMPEIRYGIGFWLEVMDEKTGQAWEVSSGGAYGCQPFLDLKRNLAGVFLPYNREHQRNSQGGFYNEASVVYLELKELIKDIIQEKSQ